MNSINVDLDEMPMYSHTDDFSGHQYYTFMGYTLELYSRTEKRTVHDLDVIQIDIENIYKTDGRGVPQPAVFFSDKQVFRSTLNGHILNTFEMWPRTQDRDWMDMFCWIKYALEHPVKFIKTHKIKV